MDLTPFPSNWLDLSLFNKNFFVGPGRIRPYQRKGRLNEIFQEIGRDVNLAHHHSTELA